MGLSALPRWHVSKLNVATAGERGQVQATETLARAWLTAASPARGWTSAGGAGIGHLVE